MYVHIEGSGVLHNPAYVMQNTFGFSCSSSSWANEDQVSTSHCKNKMEPRQIYLFDHRILIAAPADSDGFYDYQMDLKVSGLSIIIISRLLLERSHTLFHFFGFYCLNTAR